MVKETVQKPALFTNSNAPHHRMQIFEHEHEDEDEDDNRTSAMVEGLGLEIGLPP